MARVSQEFHVLPGSGGWLDQDCFLVQGIDWAMEAIKAKEAEDRHKEELSRRHHRR